MHSIRALPRLRPATHGLVTSLAGLALVVGLALALLTPQSADARTNKIRIEFVGFGTNPDFYAVVHKDPLAGDSLAVYQVGAPSAVAAVSLDGTSKSKALKSAQLAPYAIQTSGHVSGAKAPQGWSLFAGQVGAQLQVGLTDGSAQSTLGYLPLSTDSTGTESATGKVTGVFWSADGSRVVVVYNETLDDERALDVDRIAAYTLQLPAASGEGDAAAAEKKKK